jgi:hypothetical protein
VPRQAGGIGVSGVRDDGGTTGWKTPMLSPEPALGASQRGAPVKAFGTAMGVSEAGNVTRTVTLPGSGPHQFPHTIWTHAVAVAWTGTPRSSVSLRGRTPRRPERSVARARTGLTGPVAVVPRVSRRSRWCW